MPIHMAVEMRGFVPRGRRVAIRFQHCAIPTAQSLSNFKD